MVARRPRGSDAQVGLMLRQMQDVGAIDEHGVARLAGEQPPLFHFADVRDELPFDAPRLAEQRG